MPVELGLVLKLTPRGHSGNDLSLQVEAEYKVLAGGALNGIPIVANRKFSSIVRLKEGEWCVLMGLMSAVEARTLSGAYGLANLPTLGPFLRATSRSKDTSDALVVIKPHILDVLPADTAARALWTGSESRGAPLY